MGSLRDQIAAGPINAPVAEATAESYTEAIRFLARYFLEELDTRPREWEPPNESASDLGDDLFHAVSEKLPTEFAMELSGGQVASAAHLAYRAWRGD